MKNIVFATFILCGLIACEKKENIALNAYKSIDLEKKNNLILDSLAKEAQNTFDDFKLALQLNDSSTSNFFVKEKFITNDNGKDREEHIWIRNVFYDQDTLKGIVDNLPTFTKEIKQNDTIVIDENKLSDWMFYKLEPNKKLPIVIGGYSIKFMRNKLTDKEKEEFDKKNQARFD